MRLNWFSPLPPADSGIAEYTARLLPILREQADITLWTDQPKWDPELNAGATVRRYQADQVPWAELNRADLCVYHMGNNVVFHDSIWRLSRRYPGLVVLHDTCLQHLFLGLFRDVLQDRDQYLLHVTRHYGENGRKAAEKVWEGKLDICHAIESYPLTHLALENAVGALVHTRAAYEALKGENQWPVVYAPLPHPSTPCRRSEEREACHGGPPYRLVVFGHIGTNRCLEEVLTALHAFPARDCFRLDVYGSLWDSEHVRARTRSLGLEQLVTLHGYAANLDAVLPAAHLAINLRNPTMGEVSLSQLRIWDHALPTLVTRVGWYATLPEGAVAFVRPGHEVDDIQMHLQAFLADPARFARMGAYGRRVLEEQHQPEQYVQAILKFAAEAPRFRRRAAALGLAERAGMELGMWTNIRTPDGIFRGVAERIHELL